MKKTILFCTLLIVIIFFSCNKTDDFSVDFKYEYFPLEIGQSIIYDVDSVTFDFNTASQNYETDTAIFQIRYMVVDSFIDGTGVTNYEIEQARRNAPSEAWQVEKISFAARTQLRAEWTVDNRRFIKMLFPPKVDSTWNGNRYFDITKNVVVAGETLEMYKSWQYKTLAIDSVETIGDVMYDNVITIQNADDENAIEKRYAIEKYAKGVGLVYRELWILDTQCIADCVGQSWEEKAEKGFILKMTAK